MSSKTEILSFDEWYKEAKKLNDDGFSAKDFFEAGQQSNQVKVDELQKRIDRAVEHIEDYYGVVGLSVVVDILKGACDE